MLNANRTCLPITLSILLFFSFFGSVSWAKTAESLHHISAKECKTCHEEIYSQWSGSMHANSTALKDPIHGAFYKAVIGSPEQEGIKKKGKYPVCLQCHAPAAAKDGKTNLAAMPVYNEGINCVACHTITGFKGTKKPEGGLRLGIKAYEFSDNSLQGPGTNQTSSDWQHPVFQNAANPKVFKSGAVCMGCHDQRKNANKVALCQTGDEIAAAEGSSNCLTCHMPVVNGKADHSLLGGHSAKMVSKGLLMTMTVTQGSELKVIIKLANQLPHNFPTGAPFRNVYIKLTGYDTQGQEIWVSSKSHPVKDDKQAMLMYSLGDVNGNPAPPPKATQVLADTRLKPHETRELNYSVPKQGIVKLRAVAYYDLLLPAMKQKFAKPEHKILTTSKVIAVSETLLD
ncbi:MAG: cytochrome c family protein [Methyloprofundus sp.]|nr:cytochrome c family protein [Methyloprofundus sp.]